MQSPEAVAVLKRLANARLRKDTEGQDLLEYALLCALISLVAFAAVNAVGQTINDVFWETIVAANL